MCRGDTGVVVQWQNTPLSCTRPWLPPPVPGKQNKNNKTKQTWSRSRGRLWQVAQSRAGPTRVRNGPVEAHAVSACQGASAEHGSPQTRGQRPGCHGKPGEVLLPLTVKSDVSILPRVGPFSTMKLRSPVRIVETDQAGFHVSGWKSVIERHSLQERGSVSRSVHPIAEAARALLRHPNLPCVALKPSIRCYHVNTRRLKRKFSGENQLSMIIATYTKTERKDAITHYGTGQLRS